MSRRAVLGLALVAFVGCREGSLDEAVATNASRSSVPNQTAWAAGTRWTYETSFGGLHAWVYRPVGFSRRVSDRRTLVFHLIGCGQRPYQLAQAGGWPKAAEAEGAVVVIPEIVAPSHPDLSAPSVACFDFGSSDPPTRRSPDHAAIIAASQRIVAENPALAIDPRQVYLAGISAGATTAMQIACMAPDRFAGIGSVAGDSIGANQSTGVMPPSVDAGEIRAACRDYASRSPATSAIADLRRQVYAIVSDDNSLPVGLPVLDSHGHWTGLDFANPAYWDGDKFVDYDYHRLIAEAMADLFDATAADHDHPTALAGRGTGCPDGDISYAHANPTKCRVRNARPRGWHAYADTWKDAHGRTRITWLRQDTLRHRWPAGPVGPLDHAASPSLDDLSREGYFDSSGFLDEEMKDDAPNGKLGALFLANDSFDFPSWFLDLMATNNPRL